MTALNPGIARIRVLVEDSSLVRLFKEQPPDAITVALLDGSLWTITAFPQRPLDPDTHPHRGPGRGRGRGREFVGGWLDEAGEQ
jgi:hypothetical protein